MHLNSVYSHPFVSFSRSKVSMGISVESDPLHFVNAKNALSQESVVGYDANNVLFTRVICQN